MAEDMPAERRTTRQNGQFTLLDKWLDADNGVVAPERPAIPHPPALSHGVTAHAMAHAKLENTRKGGLGWHTDHKALENTELGIALHHPHELHNRIAGHEAVGIKRQHQFVVVAPTVTKRADIAGLEARVIRAAAVNQIGGTAPADFPGVKSGFFLRSLRCVVGGI